MTRVTDHPGGAVRQRDVLHAQAYLLEFLVMRHRRFAAFRVADQLAEVRM